MGWLTGQELGDITLGNSTSCQEAALATELAEIERGMCWAPPWTKHPSDGNEPKMETQTETEPKLESSRCKQREKGRERHREI